MKTKIAISSWGNIGKAIFNVYNLEKKLSDNDIDLVGIIRRKSDIKNIEGFLIVDDARELPTKPEVILCSAPSHCVMEDVEKYLQMGYSTVDCYDNHSQILHYRKKLDQICRENKVVSVLGSGWDPGFDSIQRCILELIVRGGDTVTTFGPGRSMGHTTVVKSIHPYIIDAVSLTLPGDSPGLQKREVYIVLNQNLKDESIQNQIRTDILAHDYFRNDDSHVFFVDSIIGHDTRNHGGIVTRLDENSSVETKLVGDNAIMTATAMFNTARAIRRRLDQYSFGCFTLVEIPPIEFAKGETITQRLNHIRY
jgi:diaminopimelate dehydrogenase